MHKYGLSNTPKLEPLLVLKQLLYESILWFTEWEFSKALSKMIMLIVNDFKLIFTLQWNECQRKRAKLGCIPILNQDTTSLQIIEHWK